MNLPAIVLTNRYGIFSKASGLAKVFPSASQEGLQELWQGVVQRVTTDEDLKVKDLLREFGVGAVVGGGVAVAEGSPIATRKISDVIRNFPVNRTEMSRLAEQMNVPQDGAFERLQQQPVVERQLDQERIKRKADAIAKDVEKFEQRKTEHAKEIERKEAVRKKGVADLKAELGNLYAKPATEPATDKEFEKARQIPGKEELVDDFESLSVFSRISGTGKQFWRIEPKNSLGTTIAKKLGAVEKPSGLWVNRNPLEAVAKMSPLAKKIKVAEPEKGRVPLRKEEPVGPPVPPTEIEKTNERDRSVWLEKKMTLLDAEIRGTKRLEGLKASTKLSEVKTREARLEGIRALRAELGNLYAKPENVSTQKVEDISTRIRGFKIGEPEQIQETGGQNVKVAELEATRKLVPIKPPEEPSQREAIVPVEAYRERVELLSDNITAQPEEFVKNRLQTMEEVQNDTKESSESEVEMGKQTEAYRATGDATEVETGDATEAETGAAIEVETGDATEGQEAEDLVTPVTQMEEDTLSPPSFVETGTKQKTALPSLEKMKTDIAREPNLNYGFARVSNLGEKKGFLVTRYERVTEDNKASGDLDDKENTREFRLSSEKPKKFVTALSAAKEAREWIAAKSVDISVSVKPKKTVVKKSATTIDALQNSTGGDAAAPSLGAVFSDSKNKYYASTDNKQLVVIKDTSISEDALTFPNGVIRKEDVYFPNYKSLLDTTIPDKELGEAKTQDLYNKILPLKGKSLPISIGTVVLQSDNVLKALKSLAQGGIDTIRVGTNSSTSAVRFDGENGIGIVSGLRTTPQETKHIQVMDENGITKTDESADYIFASNFGGLQSVFDSFKSKGGVEGAYTAIENMWRFHYPFLRSWSPIASDDIGIVVQWVQTMRDRIRAMKRRRDRLTRVGGKESLQRAEDIDFRVGLFDQAIQSSVVRDETRERLNSIVANAMIPLGNLESKGRSKVEDLIIEADVTGKKPTASRIAELGDDAVGAYKSVRTVLDTIIPEEIYESIRRHFGFDPDRAEIEVKKVEERFEYYKGWYFPHSFGEGDYSVWATATKYAKNKEGINQVVKKITLWHGRALTMAGAESKHKSFVSWKNKGGLKKLGERLHFKPEDFVIETGFGEDAKLDDQTYIKANQREVIDLLKASGIEEKSIEKVVELTLQTYMKRGFGRHFIGRKGVPGYLGDPFREEVYGEKRPDLHKLISGHGFSAMGFITKGAQGVKFAKILGTIPKGGKHLSQADVSRDYKYLKEWIVKQQTNSSSSDRFWDHVKNIVSILGIGFRTVAGAINSLQPETMGLLVGLSRKRWSWSAKNKKLLIPYLEKARFDVLSKRMSTEEHIALDEILLSPYVRRSTITENVGYGESAGSKIYRKMIDIAALPMSISEMLNGKTVVLTGYRLARKSGKSQEEAVREAVEFHLDVNGDYSKRGRAAIDWMNILKVPLALTSFTRNYLTVMKNATVEGDFLAIGAHLAFILSVAGPAALPFFNAVDDWWKKEEGESLMTAFRRWLRQNDLSPQWASGTVGKLFGVDVGPNFSLFIPTDGKSLLGMSGAVWRRIDAFRNEMDLGDDGRLLETFPAFPFVIHDIFKYIREKEEGKSSKKGKRDEFAPPASWITALGLRTVEQRVYSEAQQSLFAATAKAKTGKKPLLTKLARAFTSGDNERFDEIIEEIIAYNEGNRDYPERVITGEMIKNALTQQQVDKKYAGRFLENIEVE